MTSNEHLSAAIERLSATRVSETEYAYYADETGEYVRVSEGDLTDFGRRLERDAGTERACDTYSVWCAESDGEIMPEGYEPEEWEPAVVVELDTVEEHLTDHETINSMVLRARRLRGRRPVVGTVGDCEQYQVCPITVREAARADLDDLVDSVGLQTAALETIADGRCDLDHARLTAGQCLDATNTRQAIEQWDNDHDG